MTIAIDADDMHELSTQLGDAAADVRGAAPTAPGGAVFGPAVLGAAVASLDTAVRRDARELHDRWTALETGVRDALEAMSEFEAGAVSEVSQMQERLG